MTLTKHHLAYRVPSDEIARRIEAVRGRMSAESIDLLWIDHPADRLYFSGSVQDGAVVIPAGEPARLYVRKSVSRASEESPLEVVPHPGRKKLGGEIERLAGKGRRVGLTFDATPAKTYLWLAEASADATLVDVTGMVRLLRATKSAWEIEQIEAAAVQVGTLYSEIGARMRTGMTELDLTGVVEGRLRELGHGGTLRVRRPGADLSIATVVSGVSARYPTAFPGPVGAEGPHPPAAAGAGWKKLAAGETVMLDIVTAHNGYHADTTRTFFIGEDPPPEVEAAHGFCIEMLRRIEERLKPGALCSEIYREVAGIAAEAGEPPGFMGFGENRVRFFGHGVGLELDELPVLADRIDIALEPGMVLAVEPKAFLDPHGTVGIENTVVITGDGFRNLCPFDEALRLV
ncbi:MAG: Xaa-Pro peptidase family protein [Acidobacteriota bacterium]|nr:Xaa-Pro peptidase family protein [Acidobacteriota bacterium]